MKRVIQSMMCVAMLCVGSQSIAQDSMPKEKDTTGMMSKDEMMKSCMKEQSAMNANMSQSDMKKACDEKMIKMEKEKAMKQTEMTKK